MTTSEIKAELMRAREAGLEYIKARQRHRRNENKLISGKTIRYANTGAFYERNGNLVEESLCDLSDRDSEVEKCKAALSEPYCIAGKLIYLAEDPVKRQVLNQYYLYCKSWRQIARELNKSTRHIHRLHGSALSEISKKT